MSIKFLLCYDEYKSSIIIINQLSRRTMEKELWDVYDASRQKTNNIVERGKSLKPGQYHLVIHVCFFNQQNQMLIQKRSLNKEGWPGLWDISVGGAVKSGETSQHAASRESYEELGIKHDFSNQLPRLTLTFERGFDDIYIARKNIAIDQISFVDHEVCDAKWASEDEILLLIHKKQFLPIYSMSFIKYIFELNRMS